MCPPGLATVSVSDAAYAAAEEPGRTPSYYFNWLSARKALADETTSFTPAVSLIIGLNVALGLLLDAGLDERFELHRNLGRACRAGIKAMGVELFSPDEDRSAVVTAVKRARGHRRLEGRPDPARPLRHPDRGRPGRAQGQDLPHRPHRLLRRLRHHDGARRDRARARRHGRRHHARRRRHRRARGVRA